MPRRPPSPPRTDRQDWTARASFPSPTAERLATRRARRNPPRRAARPLPCCTRSSKCGTGLRTPSEAEKRCSGRRGRRRRCWSRGPCWTAREAPAPATQRRRCRRPWAAALRTRPAWRWFRIEAPPPKPPNGEPPASTAAAAGRRTGPAAVSCRRFPPASTWGSSAFGLLSPESASFQPPPLPVLFQEGIDTKPSLDTQSPGLLHQYQHQPTPATTFLMSIPSFPSYNQQSPLVPQARGVQDFL
uniref:Uncharacterized protein n=1 Tax=Zea mays TaxID=4577 RepID=A0A804MAR4_MAIZE